MNFNEIPPITAFRDAVPQWSIKTCVIVPVKNEADHLLVTLESLLEQVDENGVRLPFDSYEVLLLINNSDDDSLPIAFDFQMLHPLFNLHVAGIELPTELAHIGTARKLLMDEAHRRFELIGNEMGIIASIDGDTVADSHWIYEIGQEIAAGNDAVGGRIVTAEQAGTAEHAYLNDTEYRCLLTEVEHLLCPQLNDPLPRHFQFFGANMAVTAQYYHKAGGIPLVHCLEDMAFHEALIRCDARIRRSLKVKVTTSARFEGRVAIGFSEQLKKWSDESESGMLHVVEDSQLFINACLLKGQFRACWDNKHNIIGEEQMQDLAAALGLSGHWLRSVILSHTYFGACWAEIWEAGYFMKNKTKKFEPIQNAIENLKNFIAAPDTTIFQKDQADNRQYVDGTNA